MSAIELKNVTKVYKIYKSPIQRVLDSLFNTGRYEEYRALNGLTFSVEEGDAVGVLGKNGAGKSTLLKIITGVVKPTDGEVNIKGKISAILELNSGFDEELTGYENIFNKGILLGYSRNEMNEKVDEIVDFADIGKHIHQPVRTYSSGMKSRLGFAIAVNVDPDVLIVDEVLAVGDEVFKTKCLKKMSDFKKQGKTILFVSHSLFTVKSFCNKCAWIKDGRLIDYGDTDVVASKYETFLKEEQGKEISKSKEKNNGMSLMERKDYIESMDFKFIGNSNKFKYGEDIEYSFDYIVKQPLEGLKWSFTIRDADKKEIFSTNKRSEDYFIDNSLGKHNLKVSLKDIRLLPGKYMLSGELRNDTGIIFIGYSNKRKFEILPGDSYKGSGIVYVDHEIINR